MVHSLSSSDDGKTLFFSSPLVPRGSNVPISQRVFRSTSSGFETLTPALPINTGIWRVYAVDPNTYAWSLSTCTSLVNGGATLVSAGNTRSFDRCIAGLSRNRRYLALDGGWDNAANVPLPPALVDLATGQQNMAPAGTYQSVNVTSSGELFLVRIAGGGADPHLELSLWTPEKQRIIASIPRPSSGPRRHPRRKHRPAGARLQRSKCGPTCL